jgi:nitrite reductase/ring-hydroxylating ferredoxin subunit
MKKSFLKKTYGGYYRDIPERDLSLTAVEKGSAMGEVLRQVWQPVAMSSEVDELPKAFRMFGENLVAFRTKKGEIGILDRHCSHRGTSLEYGVPSDEGIICCYHGWHFAVNGRILETPGDPPASKLKDKLCHGAYPAMEYKGLIFGYFGPPEETPEFPIYDSFDIPNDKLVPYSLTYPCNWLQVHENIMDPVHAVFLHTRVTFTHFTENWGLLPDLQFEDTPAGMIYITTRRDGDLVWIRSNDVLLPNLGQVAYVLEGGNREKTFGNIGRIGITRWTTPIDNECCKIIGWRHFHDDQNPDDLHDEKECGLETVDFFGQTGERTYEERQRLPGDFDAQVSQGGIANHNAEHLTVCDQGVMQLRRTLRKCVKRVAAGERLEQPQRRLPNGNIPTYCHDTVIKVSGITDKNEDDVLQKIGTNIADIVVNGDYQDNAERVDHIKSRIEQYAIKINADLVT